jgi:hypothetical protein
MKLIQHRTVGSGGAASITFSNIPADFTDLLVVISARGTDSGTNGGVIRFNTGGTYSRRRLIGTGSSVFSDTGMDDYIVASSGLTANTFGNSSVYIPNYLSSAAKSYSTDGVQETNATASFQMIAAGLWSDTAAITQVVVTLLAGNLVQHSSASLYGILRGSDGITTAT